MATAFEIKAFAGVNTNHNRALGQFSFCRNIRVKNGVIKTRSGCVAVTTPTATAIKSLHSGSAVGQQSKLLLEEGSSLWARSGSGGVWTNIKNDLDTSKKLDSTRWLDYLVLVNGTHKLAYNIKTGALTTLGGSPPALEYVVTWKFRIFGWGPNSSNGNNLYFCGYDGNQDISKDVWPATFFLNIGGDAGTPIFDVIPYRSHLLCLTARGFSRVYGEDETNFEILYGGNVGILAPKLATVVGDYVFWVDQNAQIRVYSGTTADVISVPIDELLRGENFNKATLLSYNGQFWLFFNKDTYTRAYIFDIDEKAWFIDEYPFSVSAAVLHGEYMSKEVPLVGTSAGALYELDSGSSDAGATINSEFTVGPLEIEGRTIKGKRIWINAEPRNNFSLQAYFLADGAESGPTQVDFEQGPQTSVEVDASDMEGQNIGARFEALGRIDEIQKMTIVASVKGVK